MIENNKTESNPYIDGRREWNERYGSYIKRSYVMTIISIVTSLIALVSVSGVVYIGSQNKLVPYLVEVDKLGGTVATNRVEQINAINPKVIKYSLAEFVKSYRTIYPDNNIQKDLIFKVYKYLSNVYPAYNTISEYYKENSPFLTAQTKSVEVEINSVLPQNDKTWQVEWVEIEKSDRGLFLAKNRFKALITVDLVEPTTEEEILANPIGLFVKDFNHSKVLN